MLSAVYEAIVHGAPPVILTPSAVGVAWLVRVARRRRARAAVIVCAAVQAAIGMVLAGLMLNHVLGVVVRRVRFKEEMWVRFEPHVRFAGIPYDFRIYSLVLFGVLGAWAGVRLVEAARQIVRGEAEGWRGATRASIATAALAIPMLPLQPFALPVLVLSEISLASVIVGRILLVKNNTGQEACAKLI